MNERNPVALADYYKKADVLDSLSWVSLPFETRCAKLANSYLVNEGDIDDMSRNYHGPTKGTVKLYITSLFEIPRGQGVKTVARVMELINIQRLIREKREENLPYKWSRPNTRIRREAVSKRRYAIWKTDYDGKRKRATNTCIAIGRINGVLLMVDRGGYYTKSRIYMRDARNRVKVVVVDGSPLKGIVTTMQQLSPTKVLRGLYEGGSLEFDFDREGFVLNGKLEPWRNVIKIYKGKKAALNTLATPKRENPRFSETVKGLR